ncbi:MAG: HAMP domain-containing protein [Sandaracinaceae bacterium]|nr:HAMP domain-containing protein [Sandaracinaceae bacterium]
MKLSRFERRILAAIVAVQLVTIVGALWFGQGAVSEAYQVGVNDRVLSQMRRSLGIYRAHFVALRDDAERTADAIAFDRRLDEAVARGEGDAFLDGALARYENVARVVVEDAAEQRLASASRAERLDETRMRLLTLTRPLPDGARVRVTVSTPAAPFLEHQRAGELTDVYARLVAGTTYVSSFYVGIYIAFLLSVIAVALAIAILVARRVTRRVSVLADATERVGRGDLSVQVPTDGKDEIAELTRAFNEMVRDIRTSRDRIEYLQRIGAWQDFARKLAHEIKNPLTPIQLAMQQVHSTYKGGDARFQKTLEDASAIVDEEIATLRRLVGEFSEFARLPVAALEPADLGELARDALRALDRTSLVDARAPAVEGEVAETKMPVRVDAMMLKRALDNLVRNAAQAVAATSPASGGRVIVAARADADEAVLEVRDDGPGVAPADRARVVDPYYTTTADGTGLGLAIVKKVVLEHGGSIEGVEAPEGGACFRIHLPLREAE